MLLTLPNKFVRVLVPSFLHQFLLEVTWRMKHLRYFFGSVYFDQMAEWYRASASGSVDLGFDSESGQTNDLKIGIHSFPA